MKYWFEIIAVIILAAWLLGHVPLGWIADLTSHFQVQYSFLLMLLALLALCQRKWNWIPFVLLALGFSYMQLGPYFLRDAQQKMQTERPVLRVMQANVLFKNHAYSRVVESIRKYDPDILSLQEVDPTWLSAVQPALKAYPYHVERVKRGHIYGIALYSKLPLQNSAVHYYGNVGRPNLFAEIEWQKQKILLVAMHPYSPGRLMRYRLRNKQLALFAQSRQTLNSNLIVIGDLNNTPFSPSFISLLKETGLKNTRLGQGIYPTWPVDVPLMWIPIDHVLVSSNFSVTKFQTGASIGSDHFPIIVDLALK